MNLVDCTPTPGLIVRIFDSSSVFTCSTVVFENTVWDLLTHLKPSVCARQELEEHAPTQALCQKAYKRSSTA